MDQAGLKLRESNPTEINFLFVEALLPTTLTGNGHASQDKSQKTVLAQAQFGEIRLPDVKQIGIADCTRRFDG